MSNVARTLRVALGVSMVGLDGDGKAQIIQPLPPQAAEQYVSDSEAASQGDPEAANRVGEALESGRLGGFKDLTKALTFYRLAAQKGHHQAAERVAQIEGELNEGETKHETPPSSQRP